jgi:hypothetical protein
MIEDEFAELLAMVTEQLRGQNDRVADRFAERSAAVRDPLRRRDIAREVRTCTVGSVVSATRSFAVTGSST